MGVGSKGSPTYSSGRLLANVEKLGGDVSLSTIGRLGGHVSTKVQRYIERPKRNCKEVLGGSKGSRRQRSGSLQRFWWMARGIRQT